MEIEEKYGIFLKSLNVNFLKEIESQFHIQSNLQCV